MSQTLFMMVICNNRYGGLELEMVEDDMKEWIRRRRNENEGILVIYFKITCKII